MDPPPVQYVTTTDGFNVAFTVAGSGRPLVLMPWPFSNVSLIWHSPKRPLLDALAERFRLVQYDSRGQGMSTRGLSEYHSMEDYALDLDAVLDRLALDRCVLFAGPLFCHVAVRYAAQHPERVEALVLGDVRLDTAWGAFTYEDIARRDWELFLHILATSFSSSVLRGGPVELPYYRQSLDQGDCLKVFRTARDSTVREILPSVTTPTLVMQTRRLTQDSPESPWANDGRTIASLIPDARLLMFDGFGTALYSEGPEPPAAVLAIEDFLASLGLPEVSAELGPNSVQAALSTRLASPLSAREVELLRLVTQGKTNRQIAEELVISERTVINHRSHIFIKTGAENRAGATAYALRHGLA